MDTIFQGLLGVMCYIDNILVTAGSDQEHLKVVNTVVERLKFCGLWLQKSECSCLQSLLEYLGYVVDKWTTYKVNQSGHCLKSFKTRKSARVEVLYGEFIKKLSCLIHPQTDYFRQTKGRAGLKTVNTPFRRPRGD